AELPLDFIWTRDTRVRSAEAAQLAARYRFDFERAATALDADTAYTRVLAAAAHLRLSTRNATTADSLRRIAVARLAAGDASEIDVKLAAVNAGQQANIASADPLALTSATLDLQSAIGMPVDRLAITLTDTLAAPRTGAAGAAVGGATLPVASATAAMQSA